MILKNIYIPFELNQKKKINNIIVFKVKEKYLYQISGQWKPNCPLVPEKKVAYKLFFFYTWLLMTSIPNTIRGYSFCKNVSHPVLRKMIGLWLEHELHNPAIFSQRHDNISTETLKQSSARAAVKAAGSGWKGRLYTGGNILCLYCCSFDKVCEFAWAECLINNF